MTARLDVTPKTTERNRIVRTDKSEAEVTNNKKFRSRYCIEHIIEATKHTDTPEASRGLFATAEPLVLPRDATQIAISSLRGVNRHIT